MPLASVKGMITLHRILCPVDFSGSSKLAMDYATALSAWYGARLTALHVCADVPAYELVSTVGPVSVPPVVMPDVDLGQTREALDRFVAPAAKRVLVDAVVERTTDARDEILRQARTLKADLLVMGTHGRSGVEHVLLGSITEKVMRWAPCPVLVIPPHAVSPDESAPVAVFKRIVCAIDFSPSSRRALDYALSLAQEADARLTLVHAIEFPHALREIVFSTNANVDQLHAAAEAEYLRRLRAMVPPSAKMYCTVATRVTEGKPHREIERVAAADQADLIVMGVQGRGAVNLMVFGSNTNAVIRHARCPVLIVPDPLVS
jgi:nucleotide-binding universal stress UspA family protein